MLTVVVEFFSCRSQNNAYCQASQDHRPQVGKEDCSLRLPQVQAREGMKRLEKIAFVRVIGVVACGTFLWHVGYRFYACKYVVQ